MLVRVVSVVVVLVASVVPTFGQGSATAEFNGSVVDQSGAVLPGAAITLTEESTGLTRTAVSSDGGRFVLPALQPGVYTVRAELSGFQTQSRTGIRLLVGQAVTLTFTLPIGTLTDQVTVTGEAPLIEVTQTTLGSNMTTEDIENLPTQGREMLSLMQLIPGMTPQLEAGNFEGTTYSVNGRESQSSLFLVDGIHNKDDRGGAFTQVSMTIDAFSEYNVMAHDYGAEYGGASGAIVNAVTKSGTNQFRGSGYYYGQDDRFNSTNYFTKQDGREKPESGNDIVGASIGGPILRNKAFFFFNTERQWLKDALNLQYPAQAAPLAVSYADVYDVNLTKYFARLDYQLTPNHNFGFRTIWNPNTGIGEVAEDEGSIPENFRYERAKETINSANWTAVFSNRLLRELKVSSTVEHLRQAARDLYNADFNNDPFDPSTHEIVGLNGMDPLDFGSQQQHPTYRAGPRAGTAAHYWNTMAVTEQVTFTPGNHTFKFGFGASSNGGTTFTAPAGTGGPFGQFNFLTDLNFDPANPLTYPSRFRIRLGDPFFDVEDWRANFYVADKWRATDKLTLNLGLRYDYSDIVPETKDAIAPRLGVAYAANERMVFRGGVGKFYEPARNQFMYDVLGNSVISTAYSFDTGTDRASQRGQRPAHACLNPVGDGQGRALISSACRAFLVDLRNRNAAGLVYNDVATLRGTPRLGYLWSWSAGMERQLIPNVALSVDYVGNVGYDQTGKIDINEGPVGANGEVTRRGINAFDPDGTLIPAAARGVNFRRVLQYQTLEAFNTDYHALELGLVKRFASRWSGRVSYTLARSRDVNVQTGNAFAIWDRRVNDDWGVTNGHNARADYGLTNLNNTHGFTAGGNWDVGRGLGIGATFVYYTGNPVNELVGDDVNNDLDDFDRPIRGRDDADMPILSELDANGYAIHNTMPGHSDFTTVNLRVQYELPLGAAAQRLGLYWEMFNLTNRNNFGNPQNDRSSDLFGQLDSVGAPRTMQFGIRYTF
jgi:Carboxypeptidase regulatory-like domain/TonB dependent receptor/TonB-dependent Receptor Plug Domain